MSFLKHSVEPGLCLVILLDISTWLWLYQEKVRVNMGFYDKVRLDIAYPEYGVAKGMVFDSRSLHADDAEFTITANGMLIEHLVRYEDNPAVLFPKAVPDGERIVAYHGDIWLYSSDASSTYPEFVARFTHGRLEWIRPAEKYPEENRALLLEQGAR
jgi:hypothetical protein